MALSTVLLPMLRRIAPACLFLLPLLLRPSAATAQPPDASPVLQQLDLGQRLRIDHPTLGTIEGRFVSVEGTRFTILQGGGRQQLPISDVERLWVRGTSARKGALIGGAIGVAAGVVGGLLLAQVACEPTDGGDCTSAEIATVLGVVGGGSGALLGLGIGFTIPAWHLRFP